MVLEVLVAKPDPGRKTALMVCVPGENVSVLKDADPLGIKG